MKRKAKKQIPPAAMVRREMRSIPLLTREAPVANVDAEKRTFDMVWTTGMRVRRFDYMRGRFYQEELSLEPGAVRMERLKSGRAPILDSHMNWSLADVLGVVQSATLSGREGTAVGRLSQRAEVASVVADMRDGIISNVSVGYFIHRIEMIPPKKDGEDWVYRAVDWEPFEISLVPVGADSAAGVRGADGDPFNGKRSHSCEFVLSASAARSITATETHMNLIALARALGVAIADESDENGVRIALARHLKLDEKATDAQIRAAAAKVALGPGEEEDDEDPPASTATTAEQRAAFRAEETARRTGIRQAFAQFRGRPGVDDLERTCVDDGECTVEKARHLLLSKLGEGSGPLGGHVTMGEDPADKRRRAIVNSILARAGGVHKDSDGKTISYDPANPYRMRSLKEIAIECVRESGADIRGLELMDIIRFALTGRGIRGAQSTSDFPVILADVMHKEALLGMQGYAPVYTRFCKVGSVSDFRAWARLVPGLLGNLDNVTEGGEYKNKNLPDATKNTIQASRKGNIIRITPEAIVNDDLALISDGGRALGAAGPRSVDRAVFALLAANPTLSSDGVALIHATHGNTNTGAVSVATLATMANKMAKQTAPGTDAEPLDIRPAVSVSDLLVAGDIKVYNDSQYDPGSNNQKPNKVRGLVGDIVGSARAAATAFYLFADPAIAPVIEVVFLNGQRDVRIVPEEDFDTAGIKVRGELPYGVGAIDYRGVQYSTGA